MVELLGSETLVEITYGERNRLTVQVRAYRETDYALVLTVACQKLLEKLSCRSRE